MCRSPLSEYRRLLYFKTRREDSHNVVYVREISPKNNSCRLHFVTFEFFGLKFRVWRCRNFDANEPDRVELPPLALGQYPFASFTRLAFPLCFFFHPALFSTFYCAHLLLLCLYFLCNARVGDRRIAMKRSMAMSASNSMPRETLANGNGLRLIKI